MVDETYENKLWREPQSQSIDKCVCPRPDCPNCALLNLSHNLVGVLSWRYCVILEFSASDFVDQVSDVKVMRRFGYLGDMIVVEEIGLDGTCNERDDTHVEGLQFETPCLARCSKGGLGGIIDAYSPLVDSRMGYNSSRLPMSGIGTYALADVLFTTHPLDLIRRGAKACSMAIGPQ